MLAHREYRETHTTTALDGFATANSAEGNTAYQPDAAYQQETVDSIANLDSSTTHDWESIATLTSTVATLTTKLAATNAKLIKALVETTNPTTTVGKLRYTKPKPRGGGSKIPNQNYFWYCGYVCAHNSWDLLTQNYGHN